uniref:Uncharacterized protein n=1 Tax=Vitis vinifera TaxID=29760 RepID=A5BTE7_VITVI|nr:hypothetical protein VITISV_036108 [Vitis vinifera]
MTKQDFPVSSFWRLLAMNLPEWKQASMGCLSAILFAMGKHLTKQVEKMMFSKILTFEVGWFDKNQNCIGAICSWLAKDANVQESERQVQSLLCETKRLKEENDELRAQVSSSSPLTADYLSASEQHPDRMTRHLFPGT